MIPLAIPNLAGNEAKYLQECVETNFVSSIGPFVIRFEEMVATAAGARFAVATSAGTTGLHAALAAVGVTRDDLVILPSFTFIASANAIAHCGAMPWLFDVDAGSWTLDGEAVARALAGETERRDGRLVHKGSGRRVAAMMPVFTLGMPADMDRLTALAREYRLPLVVDAAPALGARYKGRAVGALGADLTVFSFNGNKTVTADPCVPRSPERAPPALGSRPQGDICGGLKHGRHASVAATPRPGAAQRRILLARAGIRARTCDHVRAEPLSGGCNDHDGRGREPPRGGGPRADPGVSRRSRGRAVRAADDGEPQDVPADRRRCVLRPGGDGHGYRCCRAKGLLSAGVRRGGARDPPSPQVLALASLPAATWP
jgi:hypothetical protein